MRSSSDVLIIDDDESILDIYSTMFSRQNHRPILARDGHIGLLMASEYEPAAVILDIVLPDLSGVDVLRQLRSRADTSRVPVFVLTNDTSEASRRVASELGIERYMIKTDMTPSQVCQCVCACLTSEN